MRYGEWLWRVQIALSENRPPLNLVVNHRFPNLSGDFWGGVDCPMCLWVRYRETDTDEQEARTTLWWVVWGFKKASLPEGPRGSLGNPCLNFGSIPIDTIFSGMNIHKSQLFWCEQKRGTRVLTHHVSIWWVSKAQIPRAPPPDLRLKVETWPGDGEWGVWQTTYVGVGGEFGTTGGPGERGEEFHATGL